MKILVFILEIIICVTLYITMNIYAEKNNKDLFQWGYWTGIIASFILYILLK